jgi:O-antigen/teichoic acid export membrane protein
MQGNDFVAGSLIIVALLQPLLSSVSVFAGFFYAQRDFVRGALYSTLVNGVTFCALLIALFLGERAIILVGTFFLVKTLIAAYCFLKARRAMRNTNEDPHLLQFSTHLSLMNVIAAIADKFDNIIIFSFLGPTQLATYAFAIGAPEQIKGVMKNLYGLALPKFAERSLSETQESVWGKLGLLTLILAGGMGVYALIAPFLFAVLFPIYLDAIPYSQWYALSIVFSGIPPIATAALTAHKKTRALYITTNTAPFVLIGALIVLVPPFGIAGAVASQIVYRMVNAGVCAWQLMLARN